MILKPRDVLVLLKLISIYPHEWAYNTLAVDLGMSPSEVHAAVGMGMGSSLRLTLLVLAVKTRICQGR